MLLLRRRLIFFVLPAISQSCITCQAQPCAESNLQERAADQFLGRIQLLFHALLGISALIHCTLYFSKLLSFHPQLCF